MYREVVGGRTELKEQEFWRMEEMGEGEAANKQH